MSAYYRTTAKLGPDLVWELGGAARGNYWGVVFQLWVIIPSRDDVMM